MVSVAYSGQTWLSAAQSTHRTHGGVMSNQASEEEYMAKRIRAMAPVRWTAAEFEVGIQDLVNSFQPNRIGAVVQVLGEAVDAAIVGWVVDFGDNGAIVFESGQKGSIVKLQQAERAVDYFRCPPLVSNRLVWAGTS